VAGGRWSGWPRAGGRRQRAQRVRGVPPGLVQRVQRRLAAAGGVATDTAGLRMAVAEAPSEYGVLLPAANLLPIVRAIGDELTGLGPLAPLLADPAVTDVLVNGPADVWVERAGTIERAAVRFASAAAVAAMVQRVVAPLGLRVDESRPWVDARLPGGERFHAVLPPLAPDGPVVTIRTFARRRLQLGDLIERGTLDTATARLLEAMVSAGIAIAVSGATGTGKTTLLNVLAAAIPARERIVTIEDVAELCLPGPHVVRLEARPPNVEGRGEVPLRELVRNALRMRPDRIVVGEVRGPEVLDMLQAANTGHRGLMTTLHASGPDEVPARLEAMALAAPGAGLDVVRRLVGGGIGAVVHLERAFTGHPIRRITVVAELVTTDDDRARAIPLRTASSATGLSATGHVPPLGQSPRPLGPCHLRAHPPCRPSPSPLPQDPHPMTATTQTRKGSGTARIPCSHPTRLGEVTTLPRTVAAVVLTLLALSMPFRTSGSRRDGRRQPSRAHAWDRGSQPGRAPRQSPALQPGRGSVWGKGSVWGRSRRRAGRSASLERPSTESRWAHPSRSLQLSGEPDPPDLFGRSGKRGPRVPSRHPSGAFTRARARIPRPGRAAIQREMEEAVPEVIDVLRATVAAGINPRRALQAAAEGAPAALEAVLGQAIRAAELGAGAGRALATAAEAEHLSELALAGEALDLAETTGAPPGPVLSGVAASAADRVRSRRAMMAATAQARLSARVVAAMAPAFLGVLALTAPADAAFLIREPLGWATLAAAMTFELLGIWWATHIVRGPTR
jgi:pilus assembly protein CpaF